MKGTEWDGYFRGLSPFEREQLKDALVVISSHTPFNREFDNAFKELLGIITNPFDSEELK